MSYSGDNIQNQDSVLGMGPPHVDGMDPMTPAKAPRIFGMSPYLWPSGSMYRPYGGDLLERNQWRQTVYLVEFLTKTDWQAATKVPPPPADDSAETKAECNELRNYMGSETQRNREDEIFGETVDFVGCFERLAFFDAHTHPVTSNLVQTMNLIGWTLVQYYKEFFGRIRPSDLDPTIVPIIRVPPFPAYPSGHATQSHLIALALKEVAPGSAGKLGGELTDLADRIGKNREIAGLHYKSDTERGTDLAKNIWDLVRANQNFSGLLDDARQEWNRPRQSGRKFIIHS